MDVSGPLARGRSEGPAASESGGSAWHLGLDSVTTRPARRRTHRHRDRWARKASDTPSSKPGARPEGPAPRRRLHSRRACREAFHQRGFRECGLTRRLAALPAFLGPTHENLFLTSTIAPVRLMSAEEFHPVCVPAPPGPAHPNQIWSQDTVTRPPPVSLQVQFTAWLGQMQVHVGLRAQVAGMSAHWPGKVPSLRFDSRQKVMPVTQLSVLTPTWLPPAPPFPG
jgi:hypothetical protein